MVLLWREWRSGQWYVVFFALVLSITAVTALYFYTDSLSQGMTEQSTKILGGDLVVTSPLPLPLAWKQEATRLKLRTAEVWTYPSVVSAGDRLQLTNIQAVSSNYPLIGEVTTPIMPQTTWVEPRLLPLLSLHLNDQIMIGAARFRITNILSSHLERLNIGWAIAPKIMIRLEDVAITRTVLPGSQVEYRLLLVGGKKELQQFRRWIVPQLNSSQRLLDISNQQSMLLNVLQRTQSYIELILLAGLMMTGVAIAMSIRQYMRRHYTHIALWRCLGAKKNHISQIIIYQLTMIALITSIIGISLGYVAQLFFINIFKDVFQFPFHHVGIKPIILGFVSSGMLLFLFASPLINELPYTSPLHIWQNQIIPSSKISLIYGLIMLISVIVFLYVFMNFSLTTLFFIDVLLLSIAFLYLLSLFLLSFIRLIIPQTEGVIRRGLSQFVHYPESVSIQIVGFTLIFMVIFLLNFVRTDIIENWQHSLPGDSPNYFAFNIASTDIPALQQFFLQHHINLADIYPMVRGRLIALNKQSIMTAVPIEGRGHNALHRELNLSWMWQFPSDNKIVKGYTWVKRDQGKPLLSIEERLAQNLQLKIGDELTFRIGSEIISATIANIRTVEWSSFHPNFFVIFIPGVIDHFPVTYITSFFLEENQTYLLNQLIQQFPNVTVIDLASVLNQLLSLISKITFALQYIFLFSLGTALLIFITSLQASMDERKQTYHLLRVLGASQKYIYRSVMVEFICFGLVIFSASLALAWIIAWLFQRTILGM